jgi:hypothetical protein
MAFSVFLTAFLRIISAFAAIPPYPESGANWGSVFYTKRRPPRDEKAALSGGLCVPYG